MSSQALPKAGYSIPEACVITGVGRSKIYQEIASGRLRTVQCGRRRIVPTDAIGEWLAKLGQEAGSQVL